MMSAKSKFLKVIILIVLVIVAGVMLYRSLAADELGSDDPVIAAALQWIRLAEKNDAAGMEKMMIAGSDPQKIIAAFMTDRKALGNDSYRTLRQKGRGPESPEGVIYEIDFDEHFLDRKRSVLLKVYVVEKSAKKYAVAAGRYISPLPSPWRDGLARPIDFAQDSPEAIARKWFDLYDQGKTAPCSQMAFIRRSFNSGKQLNSMIRQIAVDPAFQRWLDKTRPKTPPTKRELTGVQLWRDLPGLNQVEIVAANFRVDHGKSHRNERIMLLRDNYFSPGPWMPYAVHFSKWTDDKPAAKKSKPENKKK